MATYAGHMARTAEIVELNALLGRDVTPEPVARYRTMLGIADANEPGCVRSYDPTNATLLPIVEGVVRRQVEAKKAAETRARQAAAIPDEVRELARLHQRYSQAAGAIATLQADMAKVRSILSIMVMPDRYWQPVKRLPNPADGLGHDVAALRAAIEHYTPEVEAIEKLHRDIQGFVAPILDTDNQVDQLWAVVRRLSHCIAELKAEKPKTGYSG